MKKMLCLVTAALMAVGCVEQGADENASEDQLTSSVLGQTWTDGPTMTFKINGKDRVLKNAGMGIRWATPTTWKDYLDPRDPLADRKQLPESPNEALVPVYSLSVFVSDPSKLVRKDANPPGSSFESPF